MPTSYTDAGGVSFPLRQNFELKKVVKMSDSTTTKVQVEALCTVSSAAQADRVVIKIEDTEPFKSQMNRKCEYSVSLWAVWIICLWVVCTSCMSQNVKIKLVHGKLELETRNFGCSARFYNFKKNFMYSTESGRCIVEIIPRVSVILMEVNSYTVLVSIFISYAVVKFMQGQRE